MQSLPNFATISCIVSLFAVFNTLGRMANGSLSDMFQGIGPILDCCLQLLDMEVT